MSRKHTTDPKKFLSEGRWRVKIGGRMRRLGSDEQQAEMKRRKLVGEWLAAGGPGQPRTIVAPLPSQPKSVAAAVLYYLEHGMPRNLDERQKRRVTLALKQVGALYGRLLIAKFGSLELRKVREHMVDTPGVVSAFARNKKRSPLPRPRSRKYINSLVNCIKAAWAWLAAERIVPAAAVAEMKCLANLRYGQGGRETTHVLPADPEHVAKALEKMPAAVAAMIQLLWLTGMRPGEVRCMRRKELSLWPNEPLHPPNAPPIAAINVKVESGVVLVWVFAPASHKNYGRGKPRLIAFGPKAQVVLAPFVDVAGDEYLFRSEDGCFTSSGFAQAVARACRRAKVPVWRPGQLRHNVATELFPEDPLTAAAVLGHSQPSMSQYYTAQTLKKAAEQAAKAG